MCTVRLRDFHDIYKESSIFWTFHRYLYILWWFFLLLWNIRYIGNMNQTSYEYLALGRYSLAINFLHFLARAQFRKKIRMLIFAATKAVHDASLFSRLCESSVSPVGCLTSLSFFFSHCWNKKLASGRRYNARRPLFRISWPSRRVGPSIVVERGPCVLQIKLSWKQTGTTFHYTLTLPHNTRLKDPGIFCFSI